MSGTGLDCDTRRRIENWIIAHPDWPLTVQRVMIQFRLRPGDEPDVREIMTGVAVLGAPRQQEAVTSPAEVLDHLVFWLATPSVTNGEVRTCLTGCLQCRNHLLYLLDEAPYTDFPGRQVNARLNALPEVHKTHGPDGPDRDIPRIRWARP